MEAGAWCPGFSSLRGGRHAVGAGRYRHYKGPEYRVFAVARHSETEELVVFYQALYGERGLWVRPLSMFTETVEVNGETVPRFALIEAEPSVFRD